MRLNWGTWLVGLVCVALFGAPVRDCPAQTASRLARIAASGALRVCIWPEYYGVSYRNPKSGRLSGLDVDMAAEFARDLGVDVRFVDSTFASLIDDIEKDHCDIAMMAVAITPQRAQRLAFSRPYLRSDVYAVTTRFNARVRSWSDIDRAGTRVAVAAGTYHEALMRERLKHAELVVIQPPATREAELEAGRVDVFMSDYPFTHKMRDDHDWVQVLAPATPFFPVSAAYAVKPGDKAWLKRVDEFVAAVRADGRLAAAARRYRLDPILDRD
ncbi:transporter substrate-binding domain-containing protein [Niveibacterium umoris]|uniref:ABC-type amino acid transport substrate-binding protein n=1 Tax=Niveibacterium umoris TaxID=1193620 RepID=A0A840BMC0_9RHOO|nr:ABC transporter substrate-binding protein [Niveibacterium umoris]MBB4014140.1 ABC-type amino acid transport substrate-binding protein [Niveibacterium umoris]